MKLITTLFGVLIWALSTNVLAIPVYVTDGMVFDYDPDNTYFFSGTLSLDDKTFSYGANVPPGMLFYVTVAAHSQFGLFTALTTSPDFGGFLLVKPNLEAMVYAGTSYSMPFDGDAYGYVTKHHTISIDGIPEAEAYVASLPGGELQIGAVAPGIDAVPIPPAVWLFGSGLLGLVGIARRRKVKVR